jgi:hypothetical protein
MTDDSCRFLPEIEFLGVLLKRAQGLSRARAQTQESSPDSRRAASKARGRGARIKSKKRRVKK